MSPASAREVLTGPLSRETMRLRPPASDGSATIGKPPRERAERVNRVERPQD